MWLGILSFILYYSGQGIFLILENSNPNARFLGLEAGIFFRLAVFFLFPFSFILSILSIIKGNKYLRTGKILAGKITLTFGIAVLGLIFFSIPYSTFMGFIDSFSYPPSIWNYIFNKNLFLLIHILVAIFVIYRCFRYKKILI